MKGRVKLSRPELPPREADDGMTPKGPLPVMVGYHNPKYTLTPDEREHLVESQWHFITIPGEVDYEG